METPASPEETGDSEEKASSSDTGPKSYSELEMDATPSGSKRKQQSLSPDSNSNSDEKRIKQDDVETEVVSDDEKDDNVPDDEELLRRRTTKEEIEDLRKFLPQVETKHLETTEGSGCTHVVAIPKGSYYIPLQPIEKPVKSYNFTLDLFQERAVTCVDNYQSVLVSAHTSAGKTVVAEYVYVENVQAKSTVSVLGINQAI